LVLAALAPLPQALGGPVAWGKRKEPGAVSESVADLNEV
jgi:hypothetical protein